MPHILSLSETAAECSVDTLEAVTVINSAGRVLEISTKLIAETRVTRETICFILPPDIGYFLNHE